MSTAGADGKVMVLSSAVDTFGDELASLEAKGTFITAVEYVRGLLPAGFLGSLLTNRTRRAREATSWRLRARQAT